MRKEPEYITLTIPVELNEKYERILNETKTLRKEEGVLPTVEQISERTSMSEYEVRKTLQVIIEIYERQL